MESGRKAVARVVTDASFYHFGDAHSVGGFAYWVSVAGQKVARGSGKFSTPPVSPSDSEIRAVANGLHALFFSGSTFSGLEVYSDSEIALRALNLGMAQRSPYETVRVCMRYVYELLRSQNLGPESVRFLHVRAHQPITVFSTRQQLENAWCDRNARAAARRAYEEHCTERDDLVGRFLAFVPVGFEI